MPVKSRENETKMPFVIPQIESTYYASVECLYNYIRFFAFPSVSDEEKKDLFLNAYNTPLKRPDVFTEIVAAVKTADFKRLTNIITHNKVDVSKEVKSVGSHIKIPDVWPLILDCYFMENASGTAERLLSYLVSFPIYDTELRSLKLFIEKYKKADDDTRESMISGYINKEFI